MVEGADLIGMDPAASLRSVLQQAVGERTPDAILATGDLAHDPTRDVYQRFLDIVAEASDAPILCLPGNHDVLGVMQTVGMPLAPLTLDAWTLLPLDSHEDELPVALIEDSDLEQMEAHLSAVQTPYALVATHHPLTALNSPWLDKDRIKNPEELVDWLAERSTTYETDLKGIVFGHAHQECQGFCAGVPFFGPPATCFQFKPESQAFAVDDLPPGYRWLKLNTDGSMETEIGRVLDFEINLAIPDHLK